MFCFLLIGGRFLLIVDIKFLEGFLSKSKDSLREEEKEKKKKKYKKRFRIRLRFFKYYLSFKFRFRFYLKVKYCFFSVYRIARRSRWVCRAFWRSGVLCGY